MKWNEFHMYVPLAKCKTSMLYDENTVIATIGSSNEKYHGQIVVSDEPIVNYNGISYRAPSTFPAHLRKLFETEKAYTHKDVDIQRSNRFTFELYKGDEILAAGDDLGDNLSSYTVDNLYEKIITLAEELISIHNKIEEGDFDEI